MRLTTTEGKRLTRILAIIHGFLIPAIILVISSLTPYIVAYSIRNAHLLYCCERLNEPDFKPEWSGSASYIFSVMFCGLHNKNTGIYLNIHNRPFCCNVFSVILFEKKFL